MYYSICVTINAPSDVQGTEYKSKMAPQPRKAGCLPDTFDTPTPVTHIPLHLHLHPKPTTTRLPKLVVIEMTSFELI
jgi:hypothetical protein